MKAATIVPRRMKPIFQCLSNETAENYDRLSGKFRAVGGIRLVAGRSSRGKWIVIAPLLGSAKIECPLEARNLQVIEKNPIAVEGEDRYGS
jgi:hypothetical protein